MSTRLPSRCTFRDGNGENPLDREILALPCRSRMYFAMGASRIAHAGAVGLRAGRQHYVADVCGSHLRNRSSLP